jgi:hypothetical protein
MLVMAKTNAELQAEFRKRRDANHKAVADMAKDLMRANLRLKMENLALRIRYEPEKVSLWYVAWIRQNKNGAMRDGLMQGPKPSTELMTFPTEAEAKAKCAELAAQETDSRYSFIPIPDWHLEAGSYTCGFGAWSRREQVLKALEAALNEDSACSLPTE